MNRKKIIGLLTVLLVGGLGVILSGPAYATCTSTAVGFNTYAYGAGCTGAGGATCEVVTPTGNGAAAVISSFWVYKGTGTVGGNQNLNGSVGCAADASTTCGVDNGNCVDTGAGGPYCAWLFDTGPGRMAVGGQWADGALDSCIVGKTAPGHTLPIMLMSFVDQDSSGNTFVALAAGEFHLDLIRFDGTRSSTGTGTSHDITLVPLANFGSFTGSTKTSDTVRNVTFNPPATPAPAGVYTDGSSLSGAEIAALIKGFKVYLEEGPTASDRKRTGGPNTWTAITGTLPYGSSGSADVTCTTATSVVDRLAYTVVFDSDWETEMLSGNSPQTVGCGPTFATPGTPGRKIEKPGIGPTKKGPRTQ